MERAFFVFTQQRFRELRIEKQLSLEAVAELCHVTKDTVARWEASLIFPAPSKILFLAKLYNTSISYLLGETNVRAPLERNDPFLRLKEIRNDRALSIPQLSQLAKVSWSTVKKYETSPDAKPRLTVCKALADALDVSLDYLLGLTKFEKWEDSPFSDKNPFNSFQAGDAIRIEFAEGSQLAKKFGYRTNALINSGKSGIIFTEHSQVLVSHKDFRRAKITLLVPDSGGNHEK